MKAVYKREMHALFTNGLGLVSMAAVLLFFGIFATVYNLYSGSVRPEIAYQNTLLVFLVVTPVLTMYSLSFEHKNATDRLLYSLPLRTRDFILGKFIALITLTGITVFLTFLFSFVLTLYAEIDLLSAFLSSLAFFLCASSMIAIGLFVASVCRNPVISVCLTLAVLLLLYFLETLAALLPAGAVGAVLVLSVVIAGLSFAVGKISKNLWIALLFAVVLETVLLIFYFFAPGVFDGLLYDVCRNLSVTARFDDFAAENVPSLDAYVYYLSVSALFLFFTVCAEDLRRAL